MTGADLSLDQRTVTVSVSLTIRKRGGRKLIVSPNGASEWAPRQSRPDGTLVKALARAFRWRRLLEDGVYATIEELAAAEWINPSYVSRVLRLMLLRPEIVEAILDGRDVPELTIHRLFRSFPLQWDVQRQELAGTV